jgi:hypothetical protein
VIFTGTVRSWAERQRGRARGVVGARRHRGRQPEHHQAVRRHRVSSRRARKGGGKARSNSSRSSFPSLTPRATAYSCTCAADPDVGIAQTLCFRNAQATTRTGDGRVSTAAASGAAAARRPNADSAPCRQWQAIRLREDLTWAEGGALIPGPQTLTVPRDRRMEAQA